MIEVDTTSLKHWNQYMHLLGKENMPLAARGTLNQMAYETRTQVVEKEMPRAFTLRNKFEQNAVRFKSSRNTFDIDSMESSAGQLANVKFKTGAKPMTDLKKQELGQSSGPRQGSQFVRTPTLAARTGKSFSRAVARKMQPSRSDSWAKIGDIDRHMKKVPLASRIKRAHALMIQHASKVGQTKYVLPSLKAPGRILHVYRLNRKKPELIHVLDRQPRKIKPRKTIKPALRSTLNKTGDIFAQQAELRIRKTALKKLGVR